MWEKTINRTNAMSCGPKYALLLSSASLLSAFNDLMLICIEADVKERRKECSNPTECGILEDWLEVIGEEIRSRSSNVGVLR